MVSETYNHIDLAVRHGSRPKEPDQKYEERC
jgi:hypothetical protein